MYKGREPTPIYKDKALDFNLAATDLIKLCDIDNKKTACNTGISRVFFKFNDKRYINILNKICDKSEIIYIVKAEEG